MRRTPNSFTCEGEEDEDNRANPRRYDALMMMRQYDDETMTMMTSDFVCAAWKKN